MYIPVPFLSTGGGSVYKMVRVMNRGSLTNLNQKHAQNSHKNT